MQLDAFDRFALEQKGDPQDIIKHLYGVSIGKENARKGLSMVRRHLKYKAAIDQENVENIEDLEEMTTKPDGSIVSKRMLYLSAEDKKDPARIMELHGYDPIQWQMIESSTWVTYTLKRRRRRVVSFSGEYHQ